MRVLHTAWAALGLCGALVLQAHAGPVEKIALVSAIGDSISLVVYRPTVGSHLDQNRVQVFPVPNNEFDDTAVAAATQAVKRWAGANGTVTVVTPALEMAARASTVASGRLQASEALKAALQDGGATHLLLFTKHRSVAMLRLRNSSPGSGMLEGLGFYIDRSLPTRRADTRERGIGFIAPYAYFKISLVDVATWEVLKSESIMASSAVSSARDEEGVDPWNALSAEEKVALLKRLIRTETARVVPLLLGPKE
jgi:hypothetical protein